MKYYPDFKGSGAILSDPQMGAAMLSVGREAMTYAVGISPRRTGDYVRSWSVSAATIRDGGVARSSAVLKNSSDHAVPVEWGDGASRVLGRTLEEIRRRHDPKGR